MIAVILILALSLLLVFNGCTNTDSDNINTVAQDEIPSDDSEISEESGNESEPSQESSNETVAAENESKDTDVPEEETGEADSTQSSKTSEETSEEQDNSLKGIYGRFINSGKSSLLVFPMTPTAVRQPKHSLTAITPRQRN